MEPDLELVGAALGSPPPNSLVPLDSGGYTRSGRWVADMPDGKVFLKQAEDEGSLHMLRREALVYSHLSGPFLPALVGFVDGEGRAVLALEYVEHARWPPPYPDDASALFDALEQVAASPAPPGLPAHGPRSSRWQRLAEDHEPMLALGICSSTWLEASLDALEAAEALAVFEGDDLVHNDVYSGNLAFTARGAVLVDWGAAVVASRWVDVAFALLSLRTEGAAVPKLDFPDEAAFASALAGHCAVEAIAPLPAWAEPGSPLRDDQEGDLAVALRWAAEALDLEPLR